MSPQLVSLKINTAKRLNQVQGKLLAEAVIFN